MLTNCSSPGGTHFSYKVDTVIPCSILCCCVGIYPYVVVAVYILPYVVRVVHYRTPTYRGNMGAQVHTMQYMRLMQPVLILCESVYPHVGVARLGQIYVCAYACTCVCTIHVYIRRCTWHPLCIQVAHPTSCIHTCRCEYHTGGFYDTPACVRYPVPVCCRTLLPSPTRQSHLAVPSFPIIATGGGGSYYPRHRGTEASPGVTADAQPRRRGTGLHVRLPGYVSYGRELPYSYPAKAVPFQLESFHLEYYTNPQRGLHTALSHCVVPRVGVCRITEIYTTWEYMWGVECRGFQI